MFRRAERKNMRKNCEKSQKIAKNCKKLVENDKNGKKPFPNVKIGYGAKWHTALMPFGA